MPREGAETVALQRIVLTGLNRHTQFFSAALPKRLMPPLFNRYGGELVVEDPFSAPRVKLPAGDLLLYPGTSVHRVEPVTRGVRIASFFWIESMVCSIEARRLLFEMDSHLMRLRTSADA